MNNYISSHTIAQTFRYQICALLHGSKWSKKVPHLLFRFRRKAVNFYLVYVYSNRNNDYSNTAPPSGQSLSYCLVLLYGWSAIGDNDTVICVLSVTLACLIHFLHKRNKCISWKLIIIKQHWLQGHFYEGRAYQECFFLLNILFHSSTPYAPVTRPAYTDVWERVG